MKKITWLFMVLVGCWFFFCPQVMGQTEDISISIVSIQEDDRIILQNTKPNETNTPEVPKFVIKEDNGKFLMALGGYLRPIVGWDIGNVLPSVSFTPAILPVPVKAGNKSDFFSNPLHSAVDMQIVALPDDPNQVVGYVKVQFHGPNHTIQLDNIYIKYRGFTLGRVSSLFKDGASMPLTIDPKGSNGALSVTAYQTSYTSKSYIGFSFAAGIELPIFDNYKGSYHGKDYPTFDGDQFYGEASQSVPDITTYFQYKDKNENNRIRLSGVVRNFRYRDIKADNTDNVFGWGIQISGNLQPIRSLTLYYQGSYGQGIANYYQDLNGLHISYIPKDNQPGRMKATPMCGWLGGVRYEFSPKLSSNVMFSQARVWNSEEYYPTYRYSLYTAANLFYKITPYLQYGIEYLWGKLATYDKGSSSISRIQTTLRFSL